MFVGIAPYFYLLNWPQSFLQPLTYTFLRDQPISGTQLAVVLLIYLFDLEKEKRIFTSTDKDTSSRIQIH